MTSLPRFLTWKLSFQLLAALVLAVMVATIYGLKLSPQLLFESVGQRQLSAHPCPPNASHTGSSFDRKSHAAKMSLAQGQYSFQRAYEHKSPQTNPLLDRFEAEWPCFFGEEAVGTRAGDGLKWICGLRKVGRPCVVYSIGSAGNFDFEVGINDIAPQCKTFVFDHTIGPPNPLPRGVDKYIVRGLTGRHDAKNPKDRVMMTLPEIMAMLNHTHVDVLKMDCEGCEKGLIEAFTDKGWPSIGQVLVEYHDHEAKKDDKDFFRFMDGMEAAGFRLFHKEANLLGGRGHCTELAFIQATWEPGKRDYAVPKSKLQTKKKS